MGISLDKSSDCPQPRLMGETNGIRLVAILLIVTLIGSILAAPGMTLAQDETSGTASSDGLGIKVASWALTVPYCLVKTAFAIGGGIVGGLGYFFSGGNQHTAQAIWDTSITGTYIIRPANLRGEEPIHFLGHADESQGESVPHPTNPVPASPESPRKSDLTRFRHSHGGTGCGSAHKPFFASRASVSPTLPAPYLLAYISDTSHSRYGR